MNRIVSLALAAVSGAVAASLALAQVPAAPAPAAKAPASPAAVRAAAATADEAEVKRLMQEKFPGLEVMSVTKSPFFGLYEVFTGDQMAYTDAKVTYIMLGTVIDPASRTNLTEERIQALKAINVADLPLDQAIKVVRGKGERKMIVFSDADCPFCKRLENTLADMDNVTAYILLYPIDQLHPDAARKSKMIWCSADRPKAWLDYMLKGNLPANDGNCETPLPQLQALAQKYRVVATPTMVFMDGRVVPGALPKERLEKEFARADTAVKTALKN
jgi:thiol:disulfide interchange protein DsbC